MVVMLKLYFNSTRDDRRTSRTRSMKWFFVYHGTSKTYDDIFAACVVAYVRLCILQSVNVVEAS